MPAFPGQVAIMKRSKPFRMTVFEDTRLFNINGTKQQCCEVPGDVPACCAADVKRDRAFQTSALFKKPLR